MMSIRKKTRAGIYSLSFVWMFCSLLSPSFSLSETRNVLGLLFHVEELAKIDRSNVRVSVFGKRVILPEQELDSYLVDQYLRDPRTSERFERDRLRVFTSLALEQERPQWAALGLLAFLRHKDAAPEDDLEFVQELSEPPLAVEAFREVLLNLEPIDWERLYTYHMLLEVGFADPAWVRSNVAREVFGHSTGVTNYIFNQFLIATAAEDFRRAEQLRDLTAEIFGRRDTRYERLKVALHKASQAMEAKTGQELFALLQSADEDVFLSRVLQPILRKAVHGSAGALVNQAEFGEALTVLSQVPLAERSPETHDLILAALEGVIAKRQTVGFDLPVTIMIREVSANDSRVLQAYTTLLLQQAQLYLQAGELFRVESLIDEARGSLGDDSPLLQDISYQLGHRWLLAGAKSRAEHLLAPLEDSLSLMQRASLLRAGYYLDVNLLILLSTIPLILGWLFFLRLRAVFSGREADAQEIFVHGSPRPAGGEELQQKFRPLSSLEEIEPGNTSFTDAVKQGLNPRMHEYRNLLKKFSLSPNATAKEIKAAYRAAVKEVHPDAQTGRGNVDTRDVFIRMTTAYERILELRKLLQLKD